MPSTKNASPCCSVSQDLRRWTEADEGPALGAVLRALINSIAGSLPPASRVQADPALSALPDTMAAISTRGRVPPVGIHVASGVSAKLALSLLATSALFITVYMVSRSIPEDEIRSLIRTAGPGGPILLVGLLLLTYIVTPLSSSPFVFAGFYAFGQDVVLYTFIASWISSASNFWISRTMGRRPIARLVGEEQMTEIDRLTGKYGLIALFVLRVFESELHKIISYAFGVSSVGFPRYIIVSTAGMVPGTVMWYILSRKVDDPLLFTVLTQAIGIGLSGVFITGGFALRRRLLRFR
jgi:uncharacterized membrane protein YdjX (TVP38/TMEM64 family)